MSTFHNKKEMQHNAAFQLFEKVKQIFRPKGTLCFNNNRTPLDRHNGLSQVMLSNRRKNPLVYNGLRVNRTLYEHARLVYYIYMFGSTCCPFHIFHEKLEYKGSSEPSLVTYYPLKRQEKMHLKMSFAEVDCCK